jgi:hypothetical protein
MRSQAPTSSSRPSRGGVASLDSRIALQYSARKAQSQLAMSAGERKLS